MTDCVVYARVSTKEQQDEGYSLPAQLKAAEEFCTRHGLVPVAHFVEAESARQTGRAEFGRMIAYLEANTDVRTVVAHKLDRLTRNYEDLIALDRLRVQVRCVSGDVSDSPQGILFRDIQAVLARNYSLNLSQEVKKGMAEKVAQGGWAWQAPLGYLNDRATRTIVVDPGTAPLVRHAFERYASGLVSLSGLSAELHGMGLRSRSGNRVGVGPLYKLLRNPVYYGLVRYKGNVYPGAHEPLVSAELFERVQAAFAPNRTKNNPKKRSYVLRDFLYCSECGCKITAGTHKGHAYYRCTHGKGKDSCSQRRYTREELLMEQVTEILDRIAIPTSVVDALLTEARLADETRDETRRKRSAAVSRALVATRQRSATLLDNMLDDIVDRKTYQAKAAELSREAATLELRARELEAGPSETFAQVERLANLAAGAVFRFEAGSDEERRDLLANVVCNLTVEDGRIASYQYKDPFGVLVRDSSGAFVHSWWALEDLNL